MTGPDGQPVFNVNIGSTRITNQNGNQIILTVQQEGQSTDLGGTCDLIKSDSYTQEPIAVRILDASGSACYSGLSSASGKSLPAGRYTATGRVFQGGTAQKTTIQSFTLASNENKNTVTVTLDGAALSR
jgi:hypothetical protein